MFTPKGKFGWYEIMTSDTKATGKFYSDAVGWTTQEMPATDGFPYTTFNLGNVGIAGMLHMSGHSAWIGYIAVDDVDAHIEKIVEAGGKRWKPATDVPGMLRFAVLSDPQGAEIGFLSILHSWGSNVPLHPLVHCVVPGGGLSPDHQRWIYTHPRFLLPIPVLRRVFRDKFLFALKRLYSNGSLDCRCLASAFQDRQLFEGLMERLQHKKWIVYAKPPFGGPAQVLHYLGRYTHRIAISNHRLLAFDRQRVTFRYKDYAHDSKQRIMTLDAVEFLRRFFLHVLPKGFVRIRHFGLLSNRFRSRSLTLARKLLALDGCYPLPPPPPKTPARNPPLWHRPRCGGPMSLARRLTAAELSLSGHIDSS